MVHRIKLSCPLTHASFEVPCGTWMAITYGLQMLWTHGQTWWKNFDVDNSLADQNGRKKQRLLISQKTGLFALCAERVYNSRRICPLNTNSSLRRKILDKRGFPKIPSASANTRNEGNSGRTPWTTSFKSDGTKIFQEIIWSFKSICVLFCTTEDAQNPRLFSIHSSSEL